MTKFKLKSGNKTSFKRMGATEAIKQVDASSTGYPSQDKSKMHTEREIYKAKLRGDYMDLTGEKGKAAMRDDPTGQVMSKGFSIPDSPAKTHEPGHGKKEELLDQGFTQRDADLMIKHGAVTGEVDKPRVSPDDSPVPQPKIETHKEKMKRLSKKYKKTPGEIKKMLKSKEYKEGKKTM